MSPFTSRFSAFTLAILTLGLCSTAESAPSIDFTGHFKGPGVMTDTKGNKTPCAEIEITVKHSDTAMVVELYNAHCGSLNSNWGPYWMGIRNGKVFEKVDDEEQEIGELQANILKTLSASGGVQYAFNLRLNAGVAGLSLDTYYGVKNALGAIVIEGNLQPVR